MKGRAVITESDLDLTLREIRVALLEADVALEVTKKFIDNVRLKISGKDILKSIKPDQMIIKLVEDELVETLGTNISEINTSVQPPAVILFVGLQGTGKTTTVAKLANLIKNKKNKKILLASTDIYRPAAQDQLKILSNQVGVDFLEKKESNNIEEIVLRSLEKAKNDFYEILMIDTAGRQVIDKEIMKELSFIAKLSSPVEKILVADSLTGQVAANTAKEFNDLLGVTGIILTRVDGDGRGGAALSTKLITGAPIKFICTGEKVDAIETFNPKRIAKKILGMGDIVALVEKVSENINQDEVSKLEEKIKRGNFDLTDFINQLNQMQKMGGMDSMLSMIPGINKAQKNLATNRMNDEIILKQIAMFNSMTKKERSNPDIIKASRKIRISKGSGTKVQEINKLLKQFLQSKKMMKKMGKIDQGSLMNKLNIPPGFNIN